MPRPHYIEMPADYTVATAPRVRCNRLLPAPTLSNLRSADCSADSVDKYYGVYTAFCIDNQHKAQQKCRVQTKERKDS